MHNIFGEKFCLADPYSDWIPLFKKIQDFEVFQLRLGLYSLCQSTLIYTIGRNAQKELCYKELISPHAIEFYSDCCLQFRTSTMDAEKFCKQIQYQIVSFFCEGRKKESLSIDYELFNYDNKYPNEYYIRYRCPFVGLYKFGFPIYVNNSVLAVLFTGQFAIEPLSNSQSPSQNWKGFKFFPDKKEVTNLHYRHIFPDEAKLMHFAKVNLVSIVKDFTYQARQKLINHWKAELEQFMAKIVMAFEEETMAFLQSMDDILPNEEHELSMQTRFWMIIERNLQPFLAQIGTENFIIFMADSSVARHSPPLCQGYHICPKLDLCSNISYNFSLAQSILQSCGIETTTTFDISKDIPKDILFENTIIQSGFLTANSDMLVHIERVQPFSMLIEYSKKSSILENLQLRKCILDELKLFFTKVGQELAYFSIKLSEHTTKTVLRIYRHEIMHQCLVLEHNNWFLDAERLKRIDENKLRRVSEDQRQCLCELDFMTQNIDVVTGNINRRIVNLDKERYIEISSELVNKAISLHQRKKQEKFLWFTVQNNSAKGFIKSNLELLDLIFFNLMSNAIKYSYPGTNIIIGVDDTDNYVRPHIISLTDFGTAVKADTQEQVFQMYFRGNEPTYTEGSGIGLYVAHTVSEILDAKLSWSSKKISEYNVPIMMRYLSLPSDLQKTLNVDFENIQVTFEQLINSSQITRIFNQEYLEYPKQWNSHEIQGEIMRPTYEVKFMIEI